jgi:GrpB-like predicted nucleotidyltransferase (UPF0157 family)
VPDAEHTPMTQEQLRQIVVGELEELNASIVLQEYDPAWQRLFEREATRIRSALGERALVVEHAGSTAVPRLAAKPIIDIVLVVDDSSDESTYVPALEAAGYVVRIREPDWFQHRLFKGPDTNVNLHVFSRGCVEAERMLLFRDHLRRNDDDRRRYEEAKRELAARKWTYVQHYADAKSAVVAEIMARATVS